jgi:hypothetical protein
LQRVTPVFGDKQTALETKFIKQKQEILERIGEVENKK